MTRSRKHQRGFTIVEMVIVLLVIAAIVAIAIPNISHWLKIYRLDIAAQHVTDTLQTAKMQAVARTRDREVLFDVAGNRYGLEGGTMIELPVGVRFDTGGIAPPDDHIPPGIPVTFPAFEDDPSICVAAFTGRGLPDAEPGELFAVFLTNAAGTRAVTMTSAGNIRIREWTGGGWK